MQAGVGVNSDRGWWEIVCGIGSAWPGAAAPLDPGWGRLRPQTPEKLRSVSGERKGVGLSRDAKRERGASPRSANRAAVKTSLRLVSKRLLGYGGLWEGKRMEGRRGGTEGKLENCSGSGRGCCGKGWAGRAQETAASRGGGGGAKRPQRRGQGPWPPAAPLVLGPGFARPQNAAAPRRVAERGRKGGSTPHFDALALQFFGKMGTITRRINL